MDIVKILLLKMFLLYRKRCLFHEQLYCVLQNGTLDNLKIIRITVHISNK